MQDIQDRLTKEISRLEAEYGCQRAYVLTHRLLEALELVRTVEQLERKLKTLPSGNVSA